MWLYALATETGAPNVFVFVNTMELEVKRKLQSVQLDPSSVLMTVP